MLLVAVVAIHGGMAGALRAAEGPPAPPPEEEVPAAAEVPDTAGGKLAADQPYGAELGGVYRQACMSVVTIRAANDVESDLTTGFFVADDGLIATVYAGESPPDQVSVAYGGQVYEGTMVAYDAKTRLALVRAGELRGPPLEVAMSKDVELGALVGIITESIDPLKRLLPGRLAGREKHFRGRLLPVTLLRLNLATGFDPEAFGAPVLTEEGKLAGVLLLEIPGDEASIYALPSEIIDKVRENYLARGKVGYGWIGITLEEGTTTPRILECREGGPASAAGLTTGDVVLALGGKRIEEYQDVVDASYFLTPGKPVKITLLRGMRKFETTLTPVEKPAEERGGIPSDKRGKKPPANGK